MSLYKVATDLDPILSLHRSLCRVPQQPMIHKRYYLTQLMRREIDRPEYNNNVILPRG